MNIKNLNAVVVFAALACAFGANIASAQSYYPTYASSGYSGVCVNAANDLAYGSRGAAVTNLQTFLVAQNYPGGGNWMVTGYFGNATVAAVRNFQSAQNLSQTGRADAATRAAIARMSCGSSTSYNSYLNNYNYTYPNYNYGSGYTVSVPTLTSLSQNTGYVGQSVTVYGTGFDSVNNTVYFGSYAIPRVASNGTSISFVIPTYSAGGNVQITVANSRGTSNPLAFNVYASPYGCNAYNINGAGGYGSCGCNSGTYTNYNLYGYNNYSNCTNPVNNTYAPTIVSLSPSSGAVGTNVTVYGSGFTTSGNTVHFGVAVITNLISPDGQSVSFTVPTQLSGYGSQITSLAAYNVAVTNANGITSNTVPFSVTSLASGGSSSIASVNGPSVVSLGHNATWTITLNNPGNAAVTTSVNWGDQGVYPYTTTTGNMQTTYTQGSQTLTFSHVYAVGGTYTITFTVTGQNGSSSTATATVLVSNSSTSGTLSITSLSPSFGSVGTTVTIYGSGFASTGNTVRFGNGAIPSVSSYNGTTIVVTIPSYLSPYCAANVACPQYAQLVTPGTYPVSVENGSVTSGTLYFTVQ